MSRRLLFLGFAAVAVVTVALTAFLISIFERQQEAKQDSYVKLVEIQENEADPAIWGQNFPGEYEAYLRTARTAELVNYLTEGRYGGPEPFSRLEKYPALKRLFAGYAFSVEYNEDRGHLMAIEDVTAIKRLGNDKPGTCFTCKSSNVPSMMNTLGTAQFYSTPMAELLDRFQPQHAISCADCHDSKTMALRISRPAFAEAMARRGVDLSKATRQEMRNFVCAQCHVEYYFEGDGKYLVFPWAQGLNIDNIEAYYDEIGFKDWDHGETKAPLVKMQHPDFELWSTGIHARAGVGCPDCHMPYKREGSVKLTDHWIRSPLLSLNNSCTPCHRVSEDELRGRVLEIQDRTFGQQQRAEQALLEAQDAIAAAMARGADDKSLKEARELQRRAAIRWDFVSAENSMGFHSPQEAMRILGEAIDYARRAMFSASLAPAGGSTQ
ncbi:MAG: ammonia-forming cytochrome c nitrite reductase subunit c552 [Chloroflexota bacterium]